MYIFLVFTLIVLVAYVAHLTLEVKQLQAQSTWQTGTVKSVLGQFTELYSRVSSLEAITENQSGVTRPEVMPEPEVLPKGVKKRRYYGKKA